MQDMKKNGGPGDHHQYVKHNARFVFLLDRHTSSSSRKAGDSLTKSM